MALGISGIVIFALAIPVLMILALIDLLKRPTLEWQKANQSQLVWVLLVVFVAFIGPVLYFVMARPALERARIDQGWA